MCPSRVRFQNSRVRMITLPRGKQHLRERQDLQDCRRGGKVKRCEGKK
jgi:hypothetical protein